MRDFKQEEGNPTSIDRLIIDGLYVDERKPEVFPDSYIDIVGGNVKLISLDKVIIRREGSVGPDGVIIRENGGKVNEVVTGSLISTPCLKGIIKK